MLLSKKIFLSIALLAIIWLVFSVDYIFDFRLTYYGILPRRTSGLLGIVFAPFLHVSVSHIVSNTVPLFVLTLSLLLFYEKQAFIVWVGIMLISGSLVWLFAGIFTRDGIHVGASGVIYGLVAFLIASGIYQKSMKSILISLIVLVAYGSMIFGVLPTQEQVSWQGHLYGALAGFWMAYLFRNKSKKRTTIDSELL